MPRLEEKFALRSPAEVEMVRDRVRQYLSPDSHGLSYEVNSLYFDTAARDIARGVLSNRVRARQYGASRATPASTFLESKSSLSGPLVEKRRLEVPTAEWTSALARAPGWGPLLEKQIAPARILRYQREAWRGEGEIGVTLDRNLRSAPANGTSLVPADFKLWQPAPLPDDLVILELKQNATGKPEPHWLSKLRFELSGDPTSFSKYRTVANVRGRR